VLRIWRPGPKWWQENTPKLNAIAERCEQLPAVARAFARNRA